MCLRCTSLGRKNKCCSVLFRWFVHISYIPVGQRLISELAVGIMGYALYTYHWRANSIRRGGRGPFDDRLGPVSIMRFRAVCLVNSDFGVSRHYSVLHF